MKNYFQVLGLEESATLDEIKAAYRTYAKNFHPDKQNGNEFFKERFQEIQEAYEHLISDSFHETYSIFPSIINFSASKYEVLDNENVTLTWNIKASEIITLKIKTSEGIQIIKNLKPSSKITLPLHSEDRNIGISLIAENNIGSNISNLLIRNKLPSNNFKTPLYTKILFWICVIVMIAGLLFNIILSIVKKFI